MKTPDFSRRDFVKGLSAATLGALGAGYPRALVGAESETLRPPATADDDHRAVDGRGNGLDRDLRSQAVHAL